MTTEAAHNAIRSLAIAVATDPVHDEIDWAELSLVAGRNPYAKTVWSLSGYTYLADGSWRPSRTKLRTIKPAFAELVAAMQQDEHDPGWITCLFQMQRPSGKTRINFERDDDTRWAVDPADWGALPHELRPDFDKPVEPTES